MFVNKPLQSKTMAIEVTFGIRGKETTQALYVQDSEWEVPLTRLRQMIEEQSLYVPLEYKFLTMKDNAIAHPAEESIVLKEIVRYTSSKKEDESKLEDFGMTSEIGVGENVVKKPSTPKIWITPLKVNFSSASPNSASGETAASGTSATEGEGSSPSPTPENGGSQQGNEDDPLLRNETNAHGQQTPRRQCSSCPYTLFMDFVHGQKQKGPPSTKSVLKIVFLLAFILFTLLATLTLTLHVMVTTFTNIGRNPALVDLFSKLDNGFGEPSGAVSELQVKLSQMEVSSKYEIDQLTSRLAELEDLYLRDLAIHKKELNLIKKQMVHDANVYMADDEGIEDFEEKNHNYERSSKEPKRKPAAGKINERNKG